MQTERQEKGNEKEYIYSNDFRNNWRILFVFGMRLSMVRSNMVIGVAVGIEGIVDLLCLIPFTIMLLPAGLAWMCGCRTNQTGGCSAGNG